MSRHERLTPAAVEDFVAALKRLQREIRETIKQLRRLQDQRKGLDKGGVSRQARGGHDRREPSGRNQ